MKSSRVALVCLLLSVLGGPKDRDAVAEEVRGSRLPLKPPCTVAVIGGGGAGMTASWLLDGVCQVTLYEKLGRLGGDANTITVTLPDQSQARVDAGFEFLNAQEFPAFFKFLDALQVRRNPFELTATFTYRDLGRASSKTFFVTPVFHETRIQAEPEGSFPKYQKGRLRVSWKSILSPRHLSNLLKLKRFISKAAAAVEADHDELGEGDLLPLREFALQQGFKEDYQQEFLLPFLGAGWGAMLSEFGAWSSYDIFRTILTRQNGLIAPTWTEIEGGTGAYIQRVLDDSPHLEVKLNSTLSTIQFTGDRLQPSSPETGSKGRSGRWRVTSNGEVREYDHLIMATPAAISRELLREVHLKEVQHLVAGLEGLTTLRSRLFIHGDRRFMPTHERDWGVINVRTNPKGDQTGVTMYKRWLSPRHPIFKSWILEGEEEPRHSYHRGEIVYHHRKLDAAFIRAKTLMRAIQGTEGLWFVGAHTSGDRHENAILSAVQAVQRLAPGAPRLEVFK